MMEYENFERLFIIDETKAITDEEFLRYVMKKQNQYSWSAFGHMMNPNNKISYELGNLYSKLKEELENVEFLMREIHKKEQESAQ